MQKLLYVVGTILLLLACHQSDTSLTPTGDLLYQRWRLTGSTDRFITFRPDGIILYGADGKDGVCCALRFFTRQDGLLVFRNVPQKSLPADVRKADCSLVLCDNGSTEPWQIVSLTGKQLILNAYQKEIIYEAD